MRNDTPDKAQAGMPAPCPALFFCTITHPFENRICDHLRTCSRSCSVGEDVGCARLFFEIIGRIVFSGNDYCSGADVEDGTRGFPVSGLNRSTNSFSYHNQLLFSFHKVNPRIRSAARIARYSASSPELRGIYLFYQIIQIVDLVNKIYIKDKSPKME